MGATAQLQIHHRDRATAALLIEKSVAEVRRLEGIFSLYRDDSTLVELNRRKVLVDPAPELVQLLRESRRLWELTAGAFDPSVQALWRLYYEHFAKPDADAAGPAEAAREEALRPVGLEAVAFDTNRVALSRPGMMLTFNGIAQGYATDRIVDILRAGGVTSSLVDLGEPRALGSTPSGENWQVGIANPNDAGSVGEVIEVADRAVATSGGYGFRFDHAGRFNHLIDPRTGRPSELYRSVTVVHASATQADALSTGLSFLSLEKIYSVLRQVGLVEVRLVTRSGERIVLRA